MRADPLVYGEADGRTGEVVQLFSNSRSGGHSVRRIDALIQAFEARGAKVLHCESAGGVPRIDAEATHVCVAAGDGTVRHVAGAAARARRSLAMSIYPAGTVNLLAREAGYPTDPADFAAHVLDRTHRRLHYPVAIGEGHFFACAGVGPDSFAVASVSPWLKRRLGRLAYVVSLLRLLWSWPRHRITLVSSSRRTSCEAFYVAKGRYYAGNWSFAPDARVDDPALHVVALTTARRRDYVRFVLALALGRQIESRKGVEVFSCRTLTIASDQPLPIQADGDIVGQLPVTMSVSDTPLAFR